MYLLPTVFSFSLPDWIAAFMAAAPRRFPSQEARMNLVISLSRENVQRGSGGPFAAAVFDCEGAVLAVGVNLVVTSHCSLLHAEIVALTLAQQALGRYDLGDEGRARCELVSTAEPCAMCLGAIPWANPARLLCGARDSDVRAIGFDEGAKLPDWQSTLEGRGIEVVRDVLREEAVAVLQLYQQQGGLIYNAAPPA